MASNDPRRRSIFSGLLLILVGGLLLSHQFGGSRSAWIILEKWWPLIFILWGLAKLYDHFMAQRTGQAAPPTISAGEVFLVLAVLAVIGGVGIFDWGSHHVSRGDIFGIFGQSYPFSESVPPQAIPAKSQVTVRTASGAITVTADDTQQISVTARKSVNGDSESAAQERANHVHVTVTKTDNGYVVEPEGQTDSDGTISVELEVHVPKNITLDASTGGDGGIQISGIAGNVAVQSRRGSVEIRQSGADVSVDCSHGSDSIRVVGAVGNVRISGRGEQVEVSDVEGAVTLDGEYGGSLTMARIAKGVHFVSNRTDLTVTQLSGRIEIPNPSDMGIYDSTGNVTLTTTKRDLTLDNVTGKIQVDNHSGNITVRYTQLPKEPVELTTQSGDIDITLPAKSAFDVSARADNNGELSSDFSELQSKIEEQHGNTRLDGSVGSHGPKLDLRTTHATIRIRKGQ